LHPCSDDAQSALVGATRQSPDSSSSSSHHMTIVPSVSLPCASANPAKSSDDCNRHAPRRTKERTKRESQRRHVSTTHITACTRTIHIRPPIAMHFMLVHVTVVRSSACMECPYACIARCVSIQDVSLPARVHCSVAKVRLGGGITTCAAGSTDKSGHLTGSSALRSQCCICARLRWRDIH
jgi:hypothetical protein